MKTLMTIAMLTLSLNAFSASTAATSIVSGTGSFLSSEEMAKKEAAQVIVDSEEANQTGKVTEFLAEKIRNVQGNDESLSEKDALDLLVSESLSILK
jgi:hypothetical protein